MSRLARRVGVVAAVTLGVLVAWSVALRLTGTPAYEVPGPSSTLRTVVDQRGVLAGHLWVTLQGAAIGLAVACVVAAVLGLLVARWPHAERTLLAYAVVVRTIPLVGIAPTITLVFGRTLTTSVVCVGVVCTFPLMLAVLAGLRALPVELRELFGVYDAPFGSVLRHGLMPAAAGAVLLGLRTAAPFAVLGALLSEWLTGIDGLGALMVSAAANRTIGLLWAAALVTTVLGVVVYGAVGLAEHAGRRAGLDA